MKVVLEDGSSVFGDMILGCDGVHSLIRNAMWQQIDLERTGYNTAQEKTCEFP